MCLHLELSARHNPRIPPSSHYSEFTHRKSPGKRERLWLNTIEVLKLSAPGEVREAGGKLLLEPFRAPQPLHETINLALSVHQLLLAGVERMAL